MSILYFRSPFAYPVRLVPLFSALAAFTLCPSAIAQSPVVLFTGSGDMAASVAQLEQVRRAGMQVGVIVAPGAFLGTVPEFSEETRHRFDRLGTLIGPNEPTEHLELDPRQRLAVDYLVALSAGRFDQPSARAPMDWSGHPDDELIRSEEEHGGSGTGDRDADDAPDWTCTNSYNSEYMEGTVCVSAFFVESNGGVDPDQYTWPAAAINEVELQLIDAWSIWSFTSAQYGIAVTAVMDYYEPAGGVPVQGYEPVLHSSTQDNLWIEPIMQNAGYTGPNHFARCDAFNSARRNALGTDNAYCCFIAYNPPALNAPNQFTDGRIAYAYLGGPYLQILYKANGWNTDQINRVFGHETAHIFHAFDEYTSSGTSNCTRAFNGRQNINFQGSTCNGNAACVMINNTFSGSGATRKWNLCAHTPYHIGWYGRLTPPAPLAPIDDSLVATNPVVLRWNRNGAPAVAYGYVKVFDHPSGALLSCTYVAQRDTLALNLVNGSYDWSISQGNPNDGNGYAGVIGATGHFSVNAPLNASFTYTPITFCAGTSVSFTNTSTGSPTSWNWSFPGGTPSSFVGQSPPEVVYGTPGYYPVSLTVHDGSAEHTTTLPNAITSTGGAALPFTQDFNGGSFPPNGWTTTSPGQGLAWTADAVAGCEAQTAAFVNAYAFAGSFGGPQLGTPRIDLTAATLPYLRFRYSYAQETSANSETFQVYGHDCGYGVYSTFFNKAGAALTTNGGGFVTGQPWVPSTCAQWREVVVPVDPLIGHIAQFWFYVASTGGQNVFVDNVTVFNGVRLPVRVLLQGPWSPAEQLMSDGMRAQGLLPWQEPYALTGYSYADEGGGHTVNAGVFDVTGPNAIVDWLVLEIRDAGDPTRIRCSRPVLLQRDGDVVDYDGVLPPRVAVSAGNYHVCIKHRNHLGVMTAAPIALANGMGTLDLSDPLTPAWGTDARAVVGNKALLWTGNTNGNGDVRYTGSGNDRDPILFTVGSTTPNNSVYGYLREDCTLDGIVRYSGSGNDRDPILLNVGSTTPNNARLQQVP